MYSIELPYSNERCLFTKVPKMADASYHTDIESFNEVVEYQEWINKKVITEKMLAPHLSYNLDLPAPDRGVWFEWVELFKTFQLKHIKSVHINDMGNVAEALNRHYNANVSVYATESRHKDFIKIKQVDHTTMIIPEEYNLLCAPDAADFMYAALAAMRLSLGGVALLCVGDTYTTPKLHVIHYLMKHFSFGRIMVPQCSNKMFLLLSGFRGGPCERLRDYLIAWRSRGVPLYNSPPKKWIAQVIKKLTALGDIPCRDRVTYY